MSLFRFPQWGGALLGVALAHGALVLLLVTSPVPVSVRSPAPKPRQFLEIVRVTESRPVPKAETPARPAPPELEAAAAVPPREAAPPPASPVPVPSGPPSPQSPPAENEAPTPDYRSQTEVTLAPVLPGKEILARIRYPDKARRLGVQATVVLELFIDAEGRVGRIEVLQDPGYGFAAEAVRALEGTMGRPAEVQGVPVAVRYRYPVRFTLK